MTALVTALNTEFTPAVGDFIASVTGDASAMLQRKSDAAASDWAMVGSIHQRAVNISNPVAGAVYRFVSTYGTPTVRAEQ